MQGLILSPLTVPSVVLALGSYLLFGRVRLVDTPLVLVIAHTVLALPVVFLILHANVRAIDPRLQQAAMSLGARPVAVLCRVFVPLLRPGLLVGAMFAFLLSFDEAVVSIFLSGIHTRTLPRKMWEGIRFETSPIIAAVSTLLIVVAVAVVIGIYLVQRRSRQQEGWTGYLPSI